MTPRPSRSMLFPLVLFAMMALLAVAIPVMANADASDGGVAAMAEAPDGGVGEAPATAEVGAPGQLSPDDPVPFLKALASGVMGKHWILVAALVLTGLTWVTRRYLAKRIAFFKTDAGGFILAVALGVLGGVGDALSSGAKVTPDLLLLGLEVGVLGAGGWTGVKRLLKLNRPTEPDPARS
jgi:hypothetical protein